MPRAWLVVLCISPVHVRCPYFLLLLWICLLLQESQPRTLKSRGGLFFLPHSTPAHLTLFVKAPFPFDHGPPFSKHKMGYLGFRGQIRVVNARPWHNTRSCPWAVTGRDSASEKPSLGPGHQFTLHVQSRLRAKVALPQSPPAALSP